MLGVTRTAAEASACKSSARAMGLSAETTCSPLLARLYLLRAAVVERLVRVSLARQPTQPTQLLVLGAGLEDYSHFGVKAFLVDLPPVVAERASRGLVSESQVSIAADLRDPPRLLQTLHQAGFRGNQPTVVLLEFVLSYLERRSVEGLLSRLAEFPQAVLLLFDPILPPPTSSPVDFHTHFFASFASRHAPLLSCSASTEEHCLLLRSCGWRHVSSMSVQNAIRCFLTSTERKVPAGRDVFDEYGSLAVLNKHYIITIASNGKHIFDGTLRDLHSPPEMEPDEAERFVSLNSRLSAAFARLRSLAAYRNKGIEVRPFTTTDYETISAILESSFGDVMIKYNAVRKFVKAASNEIKLNADGYYGFVAVMAGMVVGYGALKVNADGSTEVKHICCHTSYRRKGIATKILSALINKAKVLAVGALNLSVLEEQLYARKLYSKFGFIEKHSEHHEQGYTLIHMFHAL